MRRRRLLLLLLGFRTWEKGVGEEDELERRGIGTGETSLGMEVRKLAGRVCLFTCLLSDGRR